MTNFPTDRPNRMVTCTICGAQMPQRFLAAHQKQHSPSDGPQPAPEKSPGGTLLCPACGQFVMEVDFSLHMTGSHADWCPLCRAVPKDLLDHLKRSHHVKPIQPFPDFGRSWQTQPRYVCLWCKKNISVWSYPRHAQPHRLRDTPPPAKSAARQAQLATCPFCKKDFSAQDLAVHVASEHPDRHPST